MDGHDFIARYAGIYEHSPWVAERVAEIASDIDDTSRLAVLMADCVDNADTEQQLALIRAHPDLAGKAQVAGELTEESSDEQASAGLDRCSKVEYERFQALNDAYKEKFGFPFVMAVRNSNRAEILEAFSARLKNDYDTEFETALAEIHTIARLRLEALRSG
ncbi:MAG: 2-oxo-4-hydroxy-4-carboxy-5-ureidoimidazoline decarboxylase [Gammaproteobacteria bacterium]|nr:2-oxo-4-hydroxy-4-carboxy-5-ureidoimidazoline decarboxylase [Gammaproteobacteria bacterium]MDH5617942.1 2-oxo-4-hydroxy-4-carboxy-5-ureidoimidazoline decarboxylase [Gammaproteobacteria bacterium]